MIKLLNQNILGNIIWFALSLAMAFLIWVIATFQVDPIIIRRVSQSIPIQIEVDPGLLVTNSPRDTAVVTVRAQESIFGVFTVEDVSIIADLHGLGPGEHTVPLIAEVALNRRAFVTDISPSQIRVVLEEISEVLVPVQAEIVNEPPAEYEFDSPVFDTNQVRVSGASSQVAQVTGAAVEIDLANQRNPLQMIMNVVPVDASGEVISEVTIEPQTVNVTVAIRQRDDIREVRITPNIVVDSLPSGYTVTSTSYEPQTILLGGSPALLRNIPNTLFTQPIELDGQTQDFQITVPVVLPNDNLLVLSEQNITVTIGITALETTQRFDDVPVGVIGLGENIEASLAPSSVTVLITGPQPVLDALNAGEIQVILDLNGLAAGNYTLTPGVVVTQGSISQENISVLPAEIDVVITDNNPGTSTPTPTETSEPTP